MKRALLALRTSTLCLCLAMSANLGRCSSAYFPPLKPLSSNSINPNTPELANADSSITSQPDQFAQKPYAGDASVSYPKIDKIEHSLYGHSYSKQDILARLSRIESSIFSTTYPNLSLSQRVDNIVANFNQINNYKNISKNELSNIESKIFHQSYPENDVQSRIERLEQQVFGAVQSGDITSRYETLRTVTRKTNTNQYAQNPYQNELDPLNPLGRPQGKLKGVMSNLGSMLLGGGGGTLTGFTPSIDPFFNDYGYGGGGYNGYSNNYSNGLYSGYNSGYNGYNNGYNNGRYNNYASLSSPNGYGQYRGYRSNHGYSDAFSSYGAGTGVTILD